MGAKRVKVRKSKASSDKSRKIVNGTDTTGGRRVDCGGLVPAKKYKFL